MTLGIDVSNFTGVPSPAKTEALWQKGYRFCIPGTQTGLDGMNYTQAQIDAFRAQGFDVPAVYVFLYWDDRDEQRTNDAMKYGLPVWLDCEWQANPMPSAAQLLHKIGMAVSQLGDQCAGIYTGGWWWKPYMANSQAFRSWPLWDANYDSNPSLSPVDYGGWTKATIHQYSSAGDEGVNCDLNAMEDAPVPTPAPLPDWNGVLVAGAEAAIKLRRGEPLDSMLQADKETLKAVADLLYPPAAATRTASINTFSDGSVKFT